LSEVTKKYTKLLSAIKAQDGVICEEVPFIFFPEDSRENSVERQQMEKLAVSLCKACPVQKICLDYALAANEPYGVWGGTLADERR
jgi:WhiB family redox-sensing transcriptional regulator